MGLTVFMRVISPLYVLTLLNCANCVLDLLGRVLWQTMGMDIAEKVSRKQDLRNPAGRVPTKRPCDVVSLEHKLMCMIASGVFQQTQRWV